MAQVTTYPAAEVLNLPLLGAGTTAEIKNLNSMIGILRKLSIDIKRAGVSIQGLCKQSGKNALIAAAPKEYQALLTAFLGDFETLYTSVHGTMVIDDKTKDVVNYVGEGVLEFQALSDAERLAEEV